MKELHQSYVNGLRSFIVDVRAKYEGEPDVKCKVVDAIWEDPGYKLIGLTGEDGQEITPGDWDELTSARRNAIQEYIDAAQGLEDQLQSLSDGDLARRYEQHIAAKQTEAAARQREQGRKADGKAFFNRQAAGADYAFWHRRVTWTAEEATALSLGKDPRHVNIKMLEKLGQFVFSPFREAFIERLDEIDRAVKAGLIEEPLTAVKFVKWAEQVGLETHSIFQNLGVLNKDVETRDPKDDIHGNRLHSMYRIILGLIQIRNAWVDDDHKLVLTGGKEAPRSAFFKELFDNLQEVGFDLSKRTLDDIVKDALKWAHTTTPTPELIETARKKKRDTEKGAPKVNPNK